MTAILTQTATAIVDALTANSFAYGSFAASRIYETSEKLTGLIAGKLAVEVCMPKPKQVLEAVRLARGDSSGVFPMSYIAVYDVDIRFKFGQLEQAEESPDVPVASVDDLLELVEDIHEFFMTNTVSGFDWLSDFENDRRRVESEILVPYHPRWLRENRMFYGCCREIFRSVV